MPNRKQRIQSDLKDLLHIQNVPPKEFKRGVKANIDVRRAFELKREGYRLEDIAAAYGVSPSTVSIHLYKAYGPEYRLIATSRGRGVVCWSTPEFIEQARQVHGDKYDYSLIDFKDMNTKVIIVCSGLHPLAGPPHQFRQTPIVHLRAYGNGCDRCARLLSGEARSLKSAIDEWAERAKTELLTEYQNCDLPLKCHCKVCDHEFERTLWNMEQDLKSGLSACPFCKGRMTPALGRKRPVICEATKETYASAWQAEESTGIDRSQIGRVCRGRALTAGGLKWSFL